MFRHQTLPVTAFQQNCSLVWCDETLSAALIDPGGDLPMLLAAVEKQGVTLEQIWVTHAHIDHAGAVGRLARERGLPIIGPQEDDQFWIDLLPNRGASFGLEPGEAFTPTRWLHDGDTVTLGHCTLQVRHCPGHTPGHVVFFEPATKMAFVGDVLFAGSIGRTDFPRGNHEQLIESITGRLWPLGDDVAFVPGHGPQSSFGQERRTNPYVRGT
jgi:hydroxyacylglutathione hydrolase